MKDELPITHLRRYYDALIALFEQEQTALAELHAKDPTLLIHRFRESVKALEKVPLIEAPFYPDGRKELPSPPTPVADIKKTHHFASQISDGRPRHVEGLERPPRSPSTQTLWRTTSRTRRGGGMSTTWLVQPRATGANRGRVVVSAAQSS